MSRVTLCRLAAVPEVPPANVLRKYADGTYRNLGLALWALARSLLSYRPSRQQNAALVRRALGYG